MGDNFAVNKMQKMKVLTTLVICALLILALFTAVAGNYFKAIHKQENISGVDGFAVLELFTSEGCSSCPPAEALLENIQKEAGGKPVYILEYHVDYWDRLGWKDVFSNPQFSERQYMYDKLLSAQVYTPQLVINGATECVGSDATAVNSAIKNAITTPGKTALAIHGQLQAGKVSITCKATGVINNGQLLIAAVQKHAVSRVDRGENKGRTLSHIQIVQSVNTFKLNTGNDTLQLALPAGFNTQDWELIGLVQSMQNGAITSATRVVL